MKLSRITKKILRPLGLELTRLRTHRGIALDADLMRLLGRDTKNLTLFDVGANIGNFTLDLLNWFPSSSIYSFEPIPDSFYSLKKALSRFPKVHCFNCAIGEESGKANMTIESQSCWNRIITDEAVASHTNKKIVVVDITTVSEFVEQQNLGQIDLLKTDCEGYDLKAIEGCVPLLKDKKIKTVYCEVNLRRDSRHGDFFAIHELLTSFGYAFYAFYDYSGIDSPQEVTFTNALWVDNRLST